MPITLPRNLTHYTSVQGLIGIVETHTIWASNVSFLNDKAELLHGLAAAESALKLILMQEPGRRIAVLEEMIASLKDSKLPDTYAACFCRKDDLLSQWRGYAGAQQGVSVTFSSAGLESLFNQYYGTPMEVIYDASKAATRLSKAIATAIRLDQFDDLLGEESDEEFQKNLLARVTKLVPRLKHEGFSEEDEWRFVIQNPEGPILFRERNGVIVPYLPITDIQRPMPIVHITVGPGKNQEVTLKSVEQFMTAKGYPKVEVKASKVPYRQ